MVTCIGSVIPDHIFEMDGTHTWEDQDQWIDVNSTVEGKLSFNQSSQIYNWVYTDMGTPLDDENFVLTLEIVKSSTHTSHGSSNPIYIGDEIDESFEFQNDAIGFYHHVGNDNTNIQVRIDTTHVQPAGQTADVIMDDDPTKIHYCVIERETTSGISEIRFACYDNEDFTGLIQTVSTVSINPASAVTDLQYLHSEDAHANTSHPASMTIDNVKIYNGIGVVADIGQHTYTPPPTNAGDWAHSGAAHKLTVGTDYVAEITRGNIGAGADTSVLDYGNPQVAELPSTGLLAHYDFEQTGSTLEDQTSNNYDSSSVGTVTKGVTGYVGDAWTFTGAGDVLFPSGQVSLGTSWTFATWLNNPSENAGEQFLKINAPNGVWCYFIGGADIKCEGATAAMPTSSGAFTTGDWHHFAVTSDGSNSKIYVDGVEEASTSTSNTVGTITSIDFGADNNSNRYTGTMDEAVFYDYALSESEIADVMNAGVLTTYPYVDAKDVATLRILDDGNQVGSTVHLDVSAIKAIDNVFLAGAIPTKAGHDSITKAINVYGAGPTVETTTT